MGDIERVTEPTEHLQDARPLMEATVVTGSELMSLPSGLGSSPRIHVTGTQDKSIRAECTSAGWFPEPKVEWLDLRGEPVLAETHFSASASTGLLAVVSIVTPQDRAVEGLTCSISNPLLPEKKVAETYLPGEYLFSSAIKATSTGVQAPSARDVWKKLWGQSQGRPCLQPAQGGHGDVGFQDETVIELQGDLPGKQESYILILVVVVVVLINFF